MIELTHSTEWLFLWIRVGTLGLVLWDSWDAVLDLRFWWARNGHPLMLAKWRIAHDVFLLILILTWIASLQYVVQTPHEAHHTPMLHTILLYQNAAVLILLAKTVYMRTIRVRIAEGE